MHIIEHTYISLLADVGSLSGFSCIRGSAYEGLDWCLNKAPQLEKQLLAYVESTEPFGTDWPAWLVPLRDRFVRDLRPSDLRLLRQLLLFCYKAEHRHTDETEKRSYEQWRSANTETLEWGRSFKRGATPSLLDSARRHVTSALAFTKWDEIIPFHGPGAVYDGSMCNKGSWSKWFSTIDYLYPYHRYFFLQNADHFVDQCDGLEVDDEIVARLIAVPKDSRGPRLICVHPAEAIWAQQGLRIKLERAMLRRRSQRWVWPRGHVHFDDQTVNGSLASFASATGSYATLDLKEASDRLSEPLVQYLFGSHYRWFGCCRAQYADLLTEKVEIGAYAPMGNATVFPVQSLVFWAICVATLESLGFHQPGDCYVFGDDIIVPTAAYPHIVESLQSFGLVVNQTKSFHKGAFRESCGVDAYKGRDVTPVRWKTTYDASGLFGLQSMSSIAQRLRMQGYHESSVTLYAELSRRVRDFGYTLSCTNNPEHGGIAEYVAGGSHAFRDAYWHRDLQWFVSPVLRLHQRENTQVHGWNHVLSSLTSLERTGRSNSPDRVPSRHSRLNRGWATVL